MIIFPFGVIISISPSSGSSRNVFSTALSILGQCFLVTNSSWFFPTILSFLKPYSSAALFMSIIFPFRSPVNMISLALSKRFLYFSSDSFNACSAFLRSVISTTIPLKPTGLFSRKIGLEYIITGNVLPSFLKAVYLLPQNFSPLSLLRMFFLALSRSSGTII